MEETTTVGLAWQLSPNSQLLGTLQFRVTILPVVSSGGLAPRTRPWVRTPEGTKDLLPFRKQPQAQISSIRTKLVDFRALPSRLPTAQTNAANAAPLSDPIFPMDLRLKDHACRPHKSC
jgi:hypothetical protein